MCRPSWSGVILAQVRRELSRACPSTLLLASRHAMTHRQPLRRPRSSLGHECLHLLPGLVGPLFEYIQLWFFIGCFFTAVGQCCDCQMLAKYQGVCAGRLPGGHHSRARCDDRCMRRPVRPRGSAPAARFLLRGRQSKCRLVCRCIATLLLSLATVSVGLGLSTLAALRGENAMCCIRQCGGDFAEVAETRRHLCCDGQTHANPIDPRNRFWTQKYWGGRR